MKMNYEISADLNKDQVFAIIKESIEKKTGKKLANIHWYEVYGDISCKLIFCNEVVETNDCKVISK